MYDNLSQWTFRAYLNKKKIDAVKADISSLLVPRMHVIASLGWTISAL